MTGSASQSSWRRPSFDPSPARWRGSDSGPSARPRPPHPGGLGAADMARAFGAEVAVDTPQRGLYLVVGRHGLPHAAVRSVGGEVMVQLEERDSVLAILAVDTHPALQRHPDVALAGPVTIDPERFARFVALAGLDRSPPPTP